MREQPPDAATAGPLAQIVADGGGRGRRRVALVVGVVVLLAAAAAGAWLLLRDDRGDAQRRFRTVALRRSALVVTVSATGNLQPTNQVDVGSELSGVIAAVLVDDNDRVKKGQLLARLDTTRLAQQVARSRATLASARARLLQARATRREARSNHE
ncbi:MAG: biotin/lipoyl-binding protein, partial [Myxococcales bacterium]|nr:biotin/lipoyl-binding protein [Myxococcales bacterium]